MTRAEAKEAFFVISKELMQAEADFERRLEMLRSFQTAMLDKFENGRWPTPAEIAAVKLGGFAFQNDLEEMRKRFDLAAANLAAASEVTR